MKVPIISFTLLYNSAALIYGDSYAPWVADPVPDYLFDSTTGCITEGANTYLCSFPDILTLQHQADVVPCPKCPVITHLRLYPGLNMSCLTVDQLVRLDTLFPRLQYVTFNNSWHRCCGTINLELVCHQPIIIGLDDHQRRPEGENSCWYSINC